MAKRGKQVGMIIGSAVIAAAGITIYFLKREGIITDDWQNVFDWISGLLLIGGVGELVRGLVRLNIPKLRSKVKGYGFVYTGVIFTLLALAFTQVYGYSWHLMVGCVGAVIALIFLGIIIFVKENKK